MSNWPAAILFDFDGVIVNSEPLHLLAFQQVLADEEIDLSEEEYLREMIGFDDRGAFQYICRQRGRSLDPQTLSRLITRKSEIVMELIRRRDYEALPGAADFVRGAASNYPLAICSGALRGEIVAMLEGVGLRDCFPIIVAAEDVTVGKPDPQGYLLAARLLSEKIGRPIQPADCLIIEDAPIVAASVRSAGFKVLAVATTYPLEKLGDAHWAVESLHPQVVAEQIPQICGTGF